MIYALQIISDDLSTLHYRTFGKQKAPLIIRTRGHRLEGIWHSGSQLGGILNLIRGVFILVPRNMTKAAGFYNTLLESDQPAMVVECLNGYRLKEKEPSNLGEFRTPSGVVETIKKEQILRLFLMVPLYALLNKPQKNFWKLISMLKLLTFNHSFPLTFKKISQKVLKKQTVFLL